ncbi:MAG: CUAEP/CCAEP-tail radical SAM protein [Pseudomonadota bacterium]|nr:CUAEP/CCAEP-tail radical SAM protein [Pseudomonadota bacterium]
MDVVLISTYELGHQPFGLAEPAACLRSRGDSVSTLDLAVEGWDEDLIRKADLAAFYVPMHTATRLAARLIPRVKHLNPRAHIAAYGLYAPTNEAYLRELGVGTVLGGEFEPGLMVLAERLESGVSCMIGEQLEPRISLAGQRFLVPDRSDLPALERYAFLRMPDGGTRVTGYVEASRGCKHRCRHCPVVPVYNGRFRAVPREIVLADLRQQVMAGARHMTFGDPDFFNGPTHAMRIVEALHEEFPELSYDVTIKVEHLLAHDRLLPKLKSTGCLFVTTAVESVDDRILGLLEKGHTREDFYRVVSIFDELGLTLSPTFVAFTPWTTLSGYRDLLAALTELRLMGAVAPVQLAIRLLIPPGSRLLELQAIRDRVGPLELAALVYPWSNADPKVDELQAEVQRVVQQAAEKPREQLFREVWTITHAYLARTPPPLPIVANRALSAELSEPWYCCAEPTDGQFADL